MQPKDDRQLGLYVHIPFCRSKCAYCDFYSFVPGSEFPARYADALVRHMESYRDGMREYEPDTVFIGGGTPTSMQPELLHRIIRALYKNFAIRGDAEFTVEANPATVDADSLAALRKLGVNRLSLGLQSGVPEELKALGRIHSREDFQQAYFDARKAGFRNISVDVMFGIPGQTMRSLGQTLRYVVRLRPEHVSLYDLILEPGTKFWDMRDKLPLPGEDEEAEMYFRAIEYLRRNGYYQYEISNFAQEGFRCRHNMKYWNCEEYLGLGPAAHSFLRGTRFSFGKNAEKYVEVLSRGSAEDLTEDFETIEPWERAGEYVMLRMRLTDGVEEGEFTRRFGMDFRDMYEEKLAPFIRAGYARHEDTRWYLTPKGMFVSNAILSEVLEFNVPVRAGGAG